MNCIVIAKILGVLASTPTIEVPVYKLDCGIQEHFVIGNRGNFQEVVVLNKIHNKPKTYRIAKSGDFRWI